MKVFVLIVLIVPIVIGEVPPPLYRNNGRIRPSPLLDFSIERPQRLQDQFPSGLTIDQLIQLTEQLQARPQKQQNGLGLKPPSAYQSPQFNRPTNNYETTNQRPTNSYQPQTFKPSQIHRPTNSYLPASGGNYQQSSINRPINSFNRPSTSYDVPQLPLEADYQQNFRPSGQQQKPPSTSYGVPNTETFDLNQLKNQNQYLPPTTTTAKPLEILTTAQPEIQEQPEANPEQTDGTLSIANSFANQVFYLRQPDGRLQKVTLQTIKEPKSRPEEYVAQYYFQNIQPQPETLYSPLVALAPLQ